MTPLRDLELLAIQAEGALDPAGRLVARYGITIACAPGAHALWIGAEVPDAAAAELAAAFAAATPAYDPAETPPALDRCRRILDAGRAVECRATGDRSRPAKSIGPCSSVLVIGRGSCRGVELPRWESSRGGTTTRQILCANSAGAAPIWRGRVSIRRSGWGVQGHAGRRRCRWLAARAIRAITDLEQPVHSRPA